MPARLVTIAVTIAVTISVTMMLGRPMLSERARFSNGKFGRGDKSYAAHSCLRKTCKPVWKPICRASAAVLVAAAEGAWRAV